jgi:hypothetical protein
VAFRKSTVLESFILPNIGAKLEERRLRQEFGVVYEVHPNDFSVADPKKVKFPKRIGRRF